MRALAAVTLLLLLGGACGGGGFPGDPAGPERVVRQVLRATEEWDTAQVTNLSCSPSREDAESGQLLTQLMAGLTAVLGLGTPDIRFKDLEFATSFVGSDEARVRVTGRMLMGAPFGSTNIDSTWVLQREAGRWCLVSSYETAAPPTQPAPSPTSTLAGPTSGVVVLRPVGQPEVRVRVELARTAQERAQGLAFREHLDADAGMLYVYEDEDVRRFWMRDTLIPLDIIFISGDLRVAGVVENAEPQTDTPREVAQPSRYVLEVNGGFAAAHGIAAGTLVELLGTE